MRQRTVFKKAEEHTTEIGEIKGDMKRIEGQMFEEMWEREIRKLNLVLPCCRAQSEDQGWKGEEGNGQGRVREDFQVHESKNYVRGHKVL